jgi:hypothetical protein
MPHHYGVDTDEDQELDALLELSGHHHRGEQQPQDGSPTMGSLSVSSQ